MRLIFIAGPYSAETEIEREKNIENGKRAGLELIMLGYAVHCPWIDSGFATVEPIPGYGKLDIYAPGLVKKLQANSMAVLLRLDPMRDGVFALLGAKQSKGAVAELKIARKRRLPIFYELKTMLNLLPPEHDDEMARGRKGL